MTICGIAMFIVVASLVLSKVADAKVNKSKTYYGRTVYDYSIANELSPDKVTLIPGDKINTVFTTKRPSGYNSTQSLAITDKYFVVFFDDTTNAIKNRVQFIEKTGNHKVVKSIDLELGHANGATYDSKHDEVLVVDGKKIHRINATTFKYLGTKTITNAKNEQYNATGIGYDAERDRFYASSGPRIRTVTADDFRIYNYLLSDHVQANQDLGYYNGYIYRVTWETKGGSEGQAWQNGKFNRDDNVFLQFAADGSSFQPFYTRNPSCEAESIAFDGGKPYILFNACNGSERQSGRYAITSISDSKTLKELYHRYTVKYDANGGTGAPGDQDNVYVGVKSKLATGKPKRTYYDFWGWAKKKDATKADYAAGSKNVLKKYGSKNSDLTLYAVWKEQTYKISYSANGGTGAPGAKEYGKAGGPVKINSGSTVKREYYEFVGWSTNKNATEADSNYKPGASYSGKKNLALYAVWKPLKYTIEYDCRGGSGCPAKSEVKKSSDATISKTKPTRKNYSFQGWALAGDYSKVVYVGGEKYTGRNNLKLYAVWKVQYFKIGFDANGGTNAPTAITRMKTAAEVKLPSMSPTRNGYKFVNWNTSKDGKGSSYAPGAKYSGRVDITLYAKWEKNNEKAPVNGVTISYDANGGINAPAPTVGVVGNIKLSTSVPQRGGFEFIGWSSNRSATSAEYQPGTAYKGTTNVVLYALWRETKVTVSYDANSGTGAPEAQSGALNTIIISMVRPVRSGYSFEGWSMKKGAKTPDYRGGDLYDGDADITLYAVWSQNAVSVVFYANDGSDDSYREDVAPGSEYKLSYRPRAHEGYTLLGWSVKKNSNAIDYALDEVITVKNAMALYAVWEAPQKTVDFDADGGDSVEDGGQTAPDSIVTDKPIVTVPETEVERDGYEFDGWSENEEPVEGEKRYKAGEKYEIPADTDEVTLHARWTSDKRYINEDSCQEGDMDCICNMDASSKECVDTAEELPKTGPGEIALLMVAIIMIVTGGVYWHRSYLELKKVEKS
jgi:uncharacterized repeat protein (TIGR02543 family)